MKIFFYMLTAISIVTIIKGIILYIKTPIKERKGKVFLPNGFFGVGSVIVSVSLICAITAWFCKEQTAVVIFLIIYFVGMVLTLAYVNCRIWYDETGFTYKNFIGIKRKATYKDITGVSYQRSHTFYVGKCKLHVFSIFKGGLDFAFFVFDKYNEACNGQKIPEIKPKERETKIFNGHVKEWEAVIATYVLLVIIALVAVGLAVYVVHFDTDTVDNTIKHTVKFISCEERYDGRIRLVTTNGDVYKIAYTDEQFNIENIKEYCDGKTSLVTYSKEAKPRKSEDYYSIKAIMHNGEFILSFEDNDRLHKQEEKFYIGIAIGISVLMALFIVSSAIVARNPQKYSRKVVRLFFKDGYVKY